MTAPSDPDSPVTPDRASIETFTRAVFGSCEGWIAVREFSEKGTPDRTPRTPFFRADGNLAQNIAREAERATSSGRALYVVTGTVSGEGKARADDVVATQTVLVDLDHGDVRSKRDHLTEHLGPPSLEVISGGTTEDGQERLHLYWRLTEPALGSDVATICKLRSVIAAKVGGDPSFGSAHQPIRVAGSIYRKGGVERLVTIRAARSLEYDLSEFAAKIEALPSLVPETTSAETAKAAATKEPAAKLFAKRIHESGVDGTTRFEALSSVIGYWIRRCNDGHVSREGAWDEIASYNEACIVSPWPVERLRQETERLWRRDHDRKAGAGDATTEFSEDAVTLQFTQRHGADWRYVAAWGQWFVWTSTHWQREATLKVYDLARIVCRDSAASCENIKLRAKIASANTVAAVERLARADRGHAASADIWDADLWSLNTPGGLVALKSGILVPHRREDANTKIATATPRGECPAWQDFLATVTGQDSALQAYLQRVVGYCLTGVTGEHALFFLYGTGANGKSVFVTTISGILGDYATVAPMDMFMAATGERHPTDMAGLRGARLVTATETEQGRRWAESKLKTLTGGDKITARFMRQDFFEFVPQFKLVVAGNHKPAIRNIDEAMRRRLHLIPFTVTIPPAERDKGLTEKLMAERDGIMAWAVDGCREWQQIGLKPPAAVSAATEQYFEAEDAIGRWLDEACVLGKNLAEKSAVLFAAWKAWAEANGEYVGSNKDFSEKLASRGFTNYRNHDGRGFRGLSLRQGGSGRTEMDL
jgi:P4 family phage/plasmid primase-like protien